MSALMSWNAYGAHFPGAAFPQLGVDITGRMPYLAFDATTTETCMLDGRLPLFASGALTLYFAGYMAAATTNSALPIAAVEKISPGEAVNQMTATYFSAFNTAAPLQVPAASGQEFTGTISLVTAAGIVTGDRFRIRFGRSAEAASDGAAGDWRVTYVELRDAR